MAEFQAIAHKISSYTEEDQIILDNEPLNKNERLQKTIGRITIENSRYREAAIKCPDKEVYYNRLIAIGERAAEAWAEVDSPEPVIVSYDGTEGIISAAIPRQVPTGFRANLPA